MNSRCSEITSRFVFATLLIAGSLGLQACIGARAVSETDKDTTGNFDGAWGVVGENTAGAQNIGPNIRINCNDRKGDQFGPIVVENGNVSLDQYGNVKGTGFVNSEGYFRLEIPTSSYIVERGKSKVQGGDITMIVSGSLKKGTGRVVFGVEKYGNAGCTTSTTFIRIT